MRGRFGRAAAVLAVSAAVAAASTGCGGKGVAAASPSGPASGRHSGAAATASASASAPAAGDGEALLRRAVAAMHAARLVTVDTKGTSDGQPTHVTAHLTAAGACAATVQDGGPAAQVIATGGGFGGSGSHVSSGAGSGGPGGFYVKAGAAYWQATSPALATVFAGRWAAMPQNGQGSGLEQYCDLAAVLSPLDTYAARGGTTQGAVTDRGGQLVVPLTQKSPEGVVTRVYVAAAGTPYVLAVENSEGAVTTVSFGGFDRDPHVVAPPASEIVKLGPGAGS